MPAVLLNGIVRSSNMSRAQKLTSIGHALLLFEADLEYAAQTDDWKGKRASWEKGVRRARDAGEMIDLYNLAQQLETSVKYSCQSAEWKHFKRDAITSLFFTLNTASPTHLAMFIYQLENSTFSWSHHRDSWKASGRDSFRRYLDAVTEPDELAAFTHDIMTQLPEIAGGRYSTFADFAQQVAVTARVLDETAGDCANCHSNCSKAKGTGGILSLVGGIYSVVGLAAAPFTGGASLALTGVGMAAGVAGGGTSAGAGLWNDAVQRAGEELSSKQILKDVHTLVLAISLAHSYSAKFEAFTRTPEGLAMVKELGKKIYKVGSLVNDAGEVLNFVKVAKMASSLNPQLFEAIGCDIATQLAAPGVRISEKVMKIFTGNSAAWHVVKAGGTAARCISMLGGVASISFGIWDVVAANKDLENGSDIARLLRNSSETARDALSLIRPVWAPELMPKETKQSCPSCQGSLVFKQGFIEGRSYTCCHADCKAKFQKVNCPKCSKTMWWSGDYDYREGWRIDCSSCSNSFWKVECSHCVRIQQWSEHNNKKYEQGTHYTCCYADCKLPIQKKTCPSCKTVNVFKGAGCERGTKVTCCSCAHKFTW